MGALAGIALLVACAASTPAAAQTGGPWQRYIDEAAMRFHLPPDWITRVMMAESAGRTMRDGVPIRSPKGAIGLMQLMPATWAEMRAAYHLGADPDDPHDNIFAGAAYLRQLYDAFGTPGLFAAYNAGPARYAASLTGRPLPRETLAYLLQVSPPPSAGDPSLAPARTRAGLFAVLGPSRLVGDKPDVPDALVLRRANPTGGEPDRGLFIIAKGPGSR